MTEETLVIEETKTPTRGLNSPKLSEVGRVKKGRPKKDKVSLKNLNPHKMLISEMLQMVSNAKTVDEKVELLQKFKCDALIKVLVVNYNPNIISRLPEGEVPYTPNDTFAGSDTHTSLHIESKKLHWFFKGGNDSISQIKLESLFIRMLEGLHKDDANLLIHIKDKKLQELYRITESVVKQAYPEFLSDLK